MQIDALIEPYLSELKRYCYMITGTPWDGEDLFQDTVIKIMRNSAKLMEHPNPKGYIFKTATNQWYDTIRKAKREIVGLSNNQDFEISSDYILLDSIEILISLLPFKQAASLLLKEYFGFTAREIASMLNMSNGGVKAAINRARNTLSNQKHFDDNYLEPTPTLLNRLLSAIKNDDFKVVVKNVSPISFKGDKNK